MVIKNKISYWLINLFSNLVKYLLGEENNSYKMLGQEYKFSNMTNKMIIQEKNLNEITHYKSLSTGIFGRRPDQSSLPISHFGDACINRHTPC